MNSSYDSKRRSEVRRKKALIKRRKQIARRMVALVTLIIILSVFVIFKLFFSGDREAPKAELKTVITTINKEVKAEDFIDKIEDRSEVEVTFVNMPDYTIYGEQKVELLLRDEAGNETGCTGNLIVSPVYGELTLEAGSTLPQALDFVADVNIQPQSITGLESDNIMGTVGDYQVIITVDDKQWNSTLHVRDTIPPEVTAKDASGALNGSISPESFIEAVSDKTAYTTAFETLPDTTSLGEKQVAILVTDGGGNITKVQVKLTIIEDKEAPVITGAEDIVVTVGGSVSYKKNITVTDNCDAEVELKVDSSQVDLNQVGSYQVTYTASDASGNQSNKTVSLIVTSADAPTEDMVNALADQVLATLIDDSMTQLEKAEKIYWWVHDSVGYVDTAPKENWVSGAYSGLKERRGDCYTYAMTAKALLTKAGIKNMDIKKVPDKASHYWNLIDIGDGWYHFDATRRKDGTTFFYVTTEFIRNYSDTHYGSHNYDASQYPEIN